MLAIGGSIFGRLGKARRNAGLQMAAERLGLRVHGRGLGGDINGYLVSVDYVSQNDSNRTRIRVAYPEWLGFNLRVATDQLGQLRKIPLFGQVMPAQDIQIGDDELDTKHLVQGDEHRVLEWFTPKRKDMIARAARNFLNIEVTDRRVETTVAGHLKDSEELSRRVRAVVFMAEVASIDDEPAALEASSPVLVQPQGEDPYAPGYDPEFEYVEVEMDEPDRGVAVHEPDIAPRETQEIAKPLELAQEGIDLPEEGLSLTEDGIGDPEGVDLSEADIEQFDQPIEQKEALPEPVAPSPAQPREPSPTHSHSDIARDMPSDIPAGIAEVELPPSVYDEPAPTTDETTVEPTPVTAPAATGSIAELSTALFGDYQPAYQIDETFGDHKGQQVTWSGTVENVAEFTRDRHLGEGPGTELELSAHEMDDGREITVIAGLPEGSDELRPGQTVTVTGTLSSLDAIMRRFYVTDARIS